MAKTLTIKIDLDKMKKNGANLYDVLEDTASRILTKVMADGGWKSARGNAEGFYTPECGEWEVRDE